MTIKTATPQHTYDHMFGTGAISYSWWLSTKSTGVDDKGDVTPEWSVKVTCDNGDGGETTMTVNHAAVLKAACEVIKDPPKYSTDALVRECKNLVFDADSCDFDSDSADELLQYIVLGEIVFG